MQTIKQHSAILKNAAKNFRAIMDAMGALQQRSLGLLKRRDQLEAQISEAETAVRAALDGRDYPGAADAAANLNRLVGLRREVLDQHEQIMGTAEQTLSPMTDANNSALAVVPALEVLERYYFDLPEHVQREIFERTSKGIVWQPKAS